MTDAIADMHCKWCQGAIVPFAAPRFRPDWKRWSCQHCGSIGYLRDPRPEELTSIYWQAWQDAEDSGRYAAGSTSGETAISLIKAATVPGKLGNCLDYGGGKGVLAARLLELGATNTTLLEPFGSQAPAAGVRCINDLESLPDEAQFDHIFMVEVIEHLLDPVAELKKLGKLLAENGRLVITTPNAKGLRARRSRGDWREAQNPTHINLFTRESLTRCLESAGYTRQRRIYRPVRYSSSTAKFVALSCLQLACLDGGIRMIASRDG